MSGFSRFFFRNRRYDDISVSIQEHIDERIDELMEEGISRDEAERTARRDFGNVTLFRERSREVWQWRRLKSLLVDLKHVCRRLRRSPGFAVTVVLTLANAQACSRWLSSTPPNLPEALTPIEHIIRASRAADTRMRSIRSLFKLQRLERKPANMAELIREAVSIIREHVNRRHISIDVDVEEAALMVSVDRIQIQQGDYQPRHKCH